MDRLHDLGMALMILGRFTLTMALTTALGVDLAGRKISGTASGLLDAHAYLYNGLQALVIGWILDATGGNWTLVCLLLAASRVISAGMMLTVRAQAGRRNPHGIATARCQVAAP